MHFVYFLKIIDQNAEDKKAAKKIDSFWCINNDANVSFWQLLLPGKKA